MSKFYGYDAQDWQKAKQEMREILILRAKARGTIPYSELVDLIEAIRIEPNSSALAAMLGEISTEEDSAGRGMLSVIVVHKGGDMQPGPGFFDLAKTLKRKTSDILACWIAELNTVHGYWGGSPKRN